MNTNTILLLKLTSLSVPDGLSLLPYSNRGLDLKIYIYSVGMGLPIYTQYIEIKVNASTAGFTAGELSHSIELILEIQNSDM